MQRRGAWRSPAAYSPRHAPAAAGGGGRTLPGSPPRPAPSSGRRQAAAAVSAGRGGAWGGQAVGGGKHRCTARRERVSRGLSRGEENSRGAGPNPGLRGRGGAAAARRVQCTSKSGRPGAPALGKKGGALGKGGAEVSPGAPRAKKLRGRTSGASARAGRGAKAGREALAAEARAARGRAGCLPYATRPGWPSFLVGCTPRSRSRRRTRWKIKRGPPRRSSTARSCTWSIDCMHAHASDGPRSRSRTPAAP